MSKAPEINGLRGTLSPEDCRSVGSDYWGLSRVDSSHIDGAGGCSRLARVEAPDFIQTSFQEIWSTCQQELRALQQKLTEATQEASQAQIDMARARQEITFWKRSCEALGRDLQKALIRLHALGEIPLP